MVKQTATIVFTGLLLAAPFGATVLAQGNGNNDDDFFGRTQGSGYGGGRVTVCHATGSRFLPYVKVTVPKQVADRWIGNHQAVYPNARGECPRGVNIRDYVRDILSGIFSRFGRA